MEGSIENRHQAKSICPLYIIVSFLMEDYSNKYPESILVNLGFTPTNEWTLPRRFAEDWMASQSGKLHHPHIKEECFANRKPSKLLPITSTRHTLSDNALRDPKWNNQSKNSKSLNTKNIPKNELKGTRTNTESDKENSSMKLSLKVNYKLVLGKNVLMCEKSTFQILMRSKFYLNNQSVNLRDSSSRKNPNTTLDEKKTAILANEYDKQKASQNECSLSEIINQCVEETKIIKVQIKESAKDINALLKRLDTQIENNSSKRNLRKEKYVASSFSYVDKYPPWNAVTEKSDYWTDMFEKKIYFCLKIE